MAICMLLLQAWMATVRAKVWEATDLSRPSAFLLAYLPPSGCISLAMPSVCITGNALCCLVSYLPPTGCVSLVVNCFALQLSGEFRLIGQSLATYMVDVLPRVSWDKSVQLACRSHDQVPITRSPIIRVLRACSHFVFMPLP